MSAARQWAAFLRGVNVGKARRIDRDTLVKTLESQGCRDVRSYIQSGNLVFRHPKQSATGIAALIESALSQQIGSPTEAVVLSVALLDAIIKARPFDEASCHVFFLKAPLGDPGLEPARDKLRATERLECGDGVVYMDAPDGLARSRVAGRMDRLLGVSTTARNWRTVLATRKLFT